MFRRAACVVLSIVYAGASALFPYWYQQENYGLLLGSWAITHLIGRAQVCLLLPLWQSYRDREIHTYVSPSLRLESPGVIREQVHLLHQHTLWDIRRSEIWLFDTIPLLLSFFCRLWVVNSFGGIQWWSVWYCLGSVLVVGSCSWLGIAAAKRYELAARRQYQQQNERIFHWVFYGSFSQEKVTLYRETYGKEAIKAVVGCWVFLGLVLGLYQLDQDDPLKKCLLLISWMSCADLLWGIWQSWIDLLGCQYTKREDGLESKQTKALHLHNLQLFSDIPAINLSLYPGELLWVQGPNGCGKTSLMKTILGQAPYAGYVEGGTDVCVLSAQMLPTCGKLADYLSRETMMLFGLDLSVRKLPRALATNVKDIQDVWSLGMLQKLNMAWALKQKKSLYILDEACNHVPRKDALLFYSLLQKQGAMVVVVSHHLCLSKLDKVKRCSLEKQTN